jgi:hypothetical protein
LFSLIVFLPLLGGGLLGLGLGAGPFPILGNLLLHALYGVILGAMLGPLGQSVDAESQSVNASDMRGLAGAEVGAARGIGIGLVLGLLVGIGLGLGGWTGPGQPGLLALLLATTVAGAAFGGMLGSMLGLPGPAEQ